MTNEGNTVDETLQALSVTELAMFEKARRAGGGQVVLMDFKHGNSRAYDVKVGKNGEIEAISAIDPNGPN
ncbi:Uncharacterised protein [Mycobacteroides abscessus subsp. abscessus]|uniref:hypothetical protein n=1 Tax=Mycobacteroides abscessus TaxID=36809 RepID=UPI00092C2E34|nr:hypothetical protein [Mycobacteroides abscessus]SIJ02326.1 Uncharacterised protein [Mycobacteroides abscessus subsp. abscessus]SIN14816.1 Uncharacterised protein [Mycobacteroides abscessus subsp. abscessus]